MEDEVISILRACLLTTKGGVPLDNVNRDYRSLEGENIPYRKLGYSSLEEFISKVPRLRQYKRGGVTYVEVIPDESTAHLSEMINKQRAPKKKPVRMNLTSRRPIINRYNQNNAKPSSRFYSAPRPQPQSPRKTGAPLRPQNAPTRTYPPPASTYSPPVTTYPPKVPTKSAEQMSPSSKMQQNRIEAQQRAQNAQQKAPSPLLPTPPPQNVNGNISKSRSPPMTPTVQNLTKVVANPPPTPKSPTAQQNFKVNAPRSVSSPPQTPTFNMNAMKITLPDAKVPAARSATSPPPLVSPQALNGNVRQPPTPPTTPGSVTPPARGLPPLKVVRPLSERLKRPSPERQPDGDRRVTFSAEVKVCDLPPVYPNPATPPPEEDQDPREELKSLARKLNLGELEYKIVKNTSKSGRVAIFCQVLVGPKYRYSSFPQEAQSELEAEKLAAASALNALHRLHGPPIAMRITQNRDIIVQRLLAIVDVHPSGVFHEQLPVYYKEKHDEILPADWTTIVAQCPELSMEKGVENSLIVCRCNPDTERVKTPQSPRSNSPSPLLRSTSIDVALAPLTLPTDELWPVHVTYVVSTWEVWARLLEDEYNDKFFAMSNELSQHYSNLTTTSAAIKLLNYYVLKENDEYHRVRVEAIDPITGDPEVFFIDTGEYQVAECSSLFALDKRFCNVPAQAIRVCLSSLEDIAICDTTTAIAERLLFDKTFYVQVLSRERDDVSHVAVGIFYNTEGEVDVNVNEQISKELCEIMEVSEMEVQLNVKGRVSEVFVSHVESNVDVYLQVKNDGMAILSSMLNALLDSVINDENIIKQATVTGPLDSLEIYLAQRPDNNWVRVQVAHPGSNNLKMNMIDFGGILEVDRTKLLKLKVLNETLARFPAQATKVTLHNVGGTRLTERMAARLRELASPGELLLCKVVQAAEFGRPAVVELFKRSQPDNLLISINNTLDLEPTLMKTNGDGNNNVKTRKRLDRTNSRSSAGDNGIVGLRKPKIPAIGEFFDVHVTSLAANPANFVVQPFEDKVKFESLMRKLQESYKTSAASPMTIDSLQEGRVYAAKSHEGTWYRACINRVMDEQSVAVYLCDYGNMIVITISQLQPLKEQFFDLPYQALKARLVGIQPTNGDWSLQTCVRFQKLVVNQNFVSVVRYSEPDDFSPTKMILGLELIDVSTDQDIYIHQILIDEQRAVPDAR